MVKKKENMDEMANMVQSIKQMAQLAKVQKDVLARKDAEKKAALGASQRK
jgi:predicted house-cleaning noncanonical NTP pyrophosphatase (MazG superfamily)